MKFILSVDLTTAAFDDDSGELRRVTGKAAKEAEQALTFGAEDMKKAIMDINGNTIGFWRLTQDSE